MADVLDERAESIRLEPLGDDAVEFYLQVGSVSQHHQVKRQQTGKVGWSLSDLNRAGVLAAFLEKLATTDVECHFVSMAPAAELDELGDRARATSSVSEFEVALGSRRDAGDNGRHRAQFDRLLGYWEGCDVETVWRFLKRIHIRTIDEETLRSTVETSLAARLDGDPAIAMALLAEFALDNVHQTLRAYDLWQHLEHKGYQRRQWASDARVHARVDRCNAVYLEGIASHTIARSLLRRAEVRQVIAALHSSRRVLITGGAGSGKSTSIAELAAELTELRWPYLALRIDDLAPVPHPKGIGAQLDRV